MKKFRFTMQGILNVRNTQRETKEMELAEARRILAEEQEKLALIDNAIREAQRPEKVIKEDTGYYLIQREKYFKFLRDKRKQQVLQIQQAEKNVDECMQRLKLAIIEEKKIQTCKDNEFKRWTDRTLKEEQKMNDEISNSLFIYKGLK